MITQDAVQVHMPDTTANIRKLEGVLDRIVDDVPFAWAAVGRGTSGFPNVLALAGNEVKRVARTGSSALNQNLIVSSPCWPNAIITPPPPTESAAPPNAIAAQPGRSVE